MWLAGYLCLGLFITIHIRMYRSLRKWLMKSHPDYPSDYPLPGWVHLVVSMPAAASAILITWIVVNI